MLLYSSRGCSCLTEHARMSAVGCCEVEPCVSAQMLAGLASALLRPHDAFPMQSTKMPDHPEQVDGISSMLCIHDSLV